MARLVGKCILMALAIGISRNVCHSVSGALQSDAQPTVAPGYPHPSGSPRAGTESPRLLPGSLRAENAQHMYSSARSVKSEALSHHSLKAPYGHTAQSAKTLEPQPGGRGLPEGGRAVPLVASVRKEGDAAGSGLAGGLPSARGQTKRLRRRDPSLLESEEEKLPSGGPRALYKGETPHLESGKLRQIEEDENEEMREGVEKGKEAGKSEETYGGDKTEKQNGEVEKASGEEKREAKQDVRGEWDGKEEDEKGQETTQQMKKGESEEEADTAAEETKEEEEESEEESREKKQEEEDSRAETMETQEEKEAEEHAKDRENKTVEDSKAEGMPKEGEEETEEEEEEGREENPEEEDVKAARQDFQPETPEEQRGEKESEKKDVGAEGMVNEEEKATEDGGTQMQKAQDDLKVEGKEEQKETEQETQRKQKMDPGVYTRPQATDREQEKRTQDDQEEADKEGEEALRTEGNERHGRVLVEKDKSGGGNETQGLGGTLQSQEMYPLIGHIRHVHLQHPYCMFSDSSWCRGKATQQEGKPLQDITDMLRQLEALVGSLSRAPYFGFPFLFPHLPHGVQHELVHPGGACRITLTLDRFVPMDETRLYLIPSERRVGLAADQKVKRSEPGNEYTRVYGTETRLQAVASIGEECMVAEKLVDAGLVGWSYAGNDDGTEKVLVTFPSKTHAKDLLEQKQLSEEAYERFINEENLEHLPPREKCLLSGRTPGDCDRLEAEAGGEHKMAFTFVLQGYAENEVRIPEFIYGEGERETK